jgi:hypothetical protein
MLTGKRPRSFAVGATSPVIAVATHPNEHLVLRQGIRVVRKHEPGGTEG